MTLINELSQVGTRMKLPVYNYFVSHPVGLPSPEMEFFEEASGIYEEKKIDSYQVPTANYSEEPRGHHRPWLPGGTDFVCDFEICCKRGLNGFPRLLALWRGIYVEERLTAKDVLERLPRQTLLMAHLCGWWMRSAGMPNVWSGYFKHPIGDKLFYIPEPNRVVGMRFLDRQTVDGLTEAAAKAEARNKQRRVRYRELKRNEQRRLAYAAQKAIKLETETQP